ncbi:Pre-mRNA-splicing factor cwc24 [Cladorrhinum sp. PSN259]|nr:Pre-mRNA-splicing factor cwc24 [Cladorrhinum sp. PSN259]
MADDTLAAPAATAAPEAAAPAPPVPVAIFKKRGAKGKANIRKQAASPPPAKDSDDSDFSSSEDEAGRRIKRRKKNGGGGAVITASSKHATKRGGDDDNELKATIFSADRAQAMDLETAAKMEAVKGSNWFDEEDKNKNMSAAELLGKTRAIVPPKRGGEEEEGKEGVYRGINNRTSYIQRNPDAPNRKVGPIKAPTNIRTITITDMAADVCKDYKQTGFCGFGDNCKFLHAREDYQHGWQLDKEWENVTKGNKNIGGTIVASVDRKRKAAAEDEGNDEAEGEMLDNIPFVCLICKEDYKSPVVTRCGHYFCEGCALKRYRKDPGCAVCGTGTGGVFNAAKKLKGMLEKKKERERRLREEEGEDDDEEEEDEE